LAAQVLANVQVTIKNVHIRYEDTTAINDHPFSCGWTLDELIAHTTDAHGSVVLCAPDVTMYKRVHVQNCGVYWNSDSPIWSTQRWTPAQLQQVMNEHVARSALSPALQHTTFLIVPFSAVLRVNFHPSGMDLTTPFTTVALALDSLELAVHKRQYRDVIKLLDDFSKVQLKSKVVHLMVFSNSKNTP
jgi:vacuolar protein sorting-associated protein 13A/C